MLFMPAIGPREKQLLSDLAEQFERRSAICSHDWLAMRKVSMDELDGICERSAIILLGSIKLLEAAGEKIPSRLSGLLEDIAGHFKRRCEVAHEEWRSHKQVDIDDIEELFMVAGAALRGYLKGSRRRRDQIFTLGALVLAAQPA